MEFKILTLYYNIYVLGNGDFRLFLVGFQKITDTF
jgi:hypothetical protein